MADARDLNAISSKVRCGFGAALAEYNGEEDHARLLAGYPPKVSLARLVNSPNGVSARMLRQRYQIRTHREHLRPPLQFRCALPGCAAADHPATR